jgi:hypothetical protein
MAMKAEITAAMAKMANGNNGWRKQPAKILKSVISAASYQRRKNNISAGAIISLSMKTAIVAIMA